MELFICLFQSIMVSHIARGEYERRATYTVHVIQLLSIIPVIKLL